MVHTSPKTLPLCRSPARSVSSSIFGRPIQLPGIYVKTGVFAIHDQVKETEPEWGDGASGFAKRVGSLQAGNIIQNSLTALGNAVVGVQRAPL